MCVDKFGFEGNIIAMVSAGFCFVLVSLYRELCAAMSNISGKGSNVSDRRATLTRMTRKTGCTTRCGRNERVWMVNLISWSICGSVGICACEKSVYPTHWNE